MFGRDNISELGDGTGEAGVQSKSVNGNPIDVSLYDGRHSTIATSCDVDDSGDGYGRGDGEGDSNGDQHIDSGLDGDDDSDSQTFDSNRFAPSRTLVPSRSTHRPAGVCLHIV